MVQGYTFQEMNDSLFEAVFDAEAKVGKKVYKKPVSAKDIEDAKKKMVDAVKQGQKNGHYEKGEITDVKAGKAGSKTLESALTVPQKHQLAIAKKTLKMSDVGASVMGGQSKKEAVEFLKSIGYSDAKIKKMSESADVDLDSLECFPLEENSTENAKKSLQAILGMFKGKKDNDIYKMGKGIMDYYKREGSFAPKHANWIWKTSVALFK